MSTPLGPKELRALERLGDVMIPGDEDFPSFSQARCIERINEIAAEAPEQDIADLAIFLRILAVMPVFILRFLCWLMGKADSFPDFAATPLRQLNIGLRGLIISPYYANLTGHNVEGKTPHDVMDYELTRIENGPS